MGVVADRHLVLLHDLEQRRLHLGGRAVDLVGEQEVAEHRAELGVEPARVGPVDARADEVGGHEVGRELQALERAAEHVGDRLDGQGLGQAGHALEQHVAAGQQRHEHALEHRLLADDHPLDLEQRGLERVVGQAGGPRVLVVALQRPQAALLGCHANRLRSPRIRGCSTFSGCVPSVTVEGTPLTAALHDHTHLVAGSAGVDDRRDVVRLAHRRARDLHDPVALAQAGLGGRAAGDHAADRGAALGGRAAGDAEVGVLDLLALLQRRDRALDRVDRHGEADAGVLVAAAVGPDLGVDADHAALRRRAAGRRSCRG